MPMRARRRLTIGGVAAAAAGGLGGGAGADPSSVGWSQVTEAPNGFMLFEPSASHDGSRIAFSSGYNFTGDNPEHNFEVFVFDRVDGSFQQLTSTPFGFGNFEPLITPDGLTVVFRSKFDFTGGNADGNFELYQVNLATGAVSQLTDNPGNIAVYEPAMSGDGTRVVYRMLGDPVGMNPDGNFELFMVNRLTLSVRQLTVSPFGYLNDQPAVSGDGARVVFRSRFDADGSNPNENIEIWCWEHGRDGIFPVTVTDGIGQSEAPDVDASGRTVAFISVHDFTGANPDGTREIFLADLETGAFVQATESAPLMHLEPVLSPTGDFVVFESQRNPIGQNPDQNRELFYFDAVTRELSQLTDTLGGSSIFRLTERAKTRYAAVSGHGGVFVYRSEHDLIGGIGTGNVELFAADHACHAIACPADLDGDGQVGSADLNTLLDAFGMASPPTADLDADGDVDSMDLNLMLGQFGAGCPAP